MMERKNNAMLILLVFLLAASIAGCDQPISTAPELQGNTEEYFAAHGIVPGQVNELRIGGTLFRFPAGVGLNPYTAQEVIRTKDGSPMTLSQKECLEQDKCEKVATPIVMGQADKVTFYLDPTRNYTPGSNPYGGGVRVEIYDRQNSTWDGVNANLDSYLKETQGRKIIEHPASGLREYVAPSAGSSGLYEDIRPGRKSTSGYGRLFSCQSGLTGFCFIGHYDPAGRYMYQIVATQAFVLEHWPELQPAVRRFIDSVIVK